MRSSRLGALVGLKLPEENRIEGAARSQATALVLGQDNLYIVLAEKPVY